MNLDVEEIRRKLRNACDRDNIVIDITLRHDKLWMVYCPSYLWPLLNEIGIPTYRNWIEALRKSRYSTFEKNDANYDPSNIYIRGKLKINLR